MDKFYLTAGLFAALLAGCGKHASRQEMPPLRVEVAEAVVDSVPNRMSFIGYLASNFDAVIQPRVNGYLSSKRYSNGMPVKRGQLLFTIDPDQLSTSMLAAEAQLESARAQAIEARNNYDRAVPLAKINAISQAQLDQYTAQWKAAEASVRAAEQTLSSARMNVGYAELRSPIDGIVEHTAAHVGDYVGPGTQYPHEGRYDYTRKDVSSTTGTLVLVVMFPNPDEALKPGQFARVEANVGPVRPRVVVPQQGVSQAQDLSSVWVVAADSTAHYRRVIPGDTYGALWCIDEGLEPGERIVVAGQQKLRNGAKVIPEKR